MKRPAPGSFARRQMPPGHLAWLEEAEAEAERLREQNARLKRFVRLTASGGKWPDSEASDITAPPSGAA